MTMLWGPGPVFASGPAYTRLGTGDLGKPGASSLCVGISCRGSRCCLGTGRGRPDVNARALPKMAAAATLLYGSARAEQSTERNWKPGRAYLPRLA